MEYEEITFNDIPRAMANILRKCDLLEQSIDVLREEIRQTNKPSTSQHIPMDVKEACDFLKIKKSTMYLYIQNGQIPVNKKGKKYTFFNHLKTRKSTSWHRRKRKGHCFICLNIV